ncbi:MAG TPA: pyridoxamine 5'-phosphate oxidase family protein, partial [Alkalispirochaeta sp.]|nr:pyridoxamine 5'-phosphate oxidase family protein [Alkalispirochaeta sp.]
MSHLHDDQELREIWDELEAGVAQGPHPFHTAALATVGTHSGTPVAAEVRTVVLRYVDREGWRVDLHTDLRSPKVAEIRANPAVSLLFYDAPGKRQLRAKGRATIHTQDDLTAARWETMRSQSRECYRAPGAPSSPVAGPAAGAEAGSAAGAEAGPAAGAEAGSA